MNQTATALARTSTTGIVTSVIRKFRQKHLTSQTEAELSALSDAVLRDIGISRNEISSFSRDHAARLTR